MTLMALKHLCANVQGLVAEAKKKKGQGGQCVAPYDRCVERREKEISH